MSAWEPGSEVGGVLPGEKSVMPVGVMVWRSMYSWNREGVAVLKSAGFTAGSTKGSAGASTDSTTGSFTGCSTGGSTGGMTGTCTGWLFFWLATDGYLFL